MPKVPSSVKNPLRFAAGEDIVLQQVGRVVRGAQRQRQRRVGAQQLRHPRQLPGEALVVPRAHLEVRIKLITYFSTSPI